MKLALLLPFVLSACASTAAPETAPWDAPSAAGPVLIGVVTHPDGHPLEGVPVQSHGGFATRFPGAVVFTDADGRYRFDPVVGSPTWDDDGATTYQYVGVCVGSVSGGNPPEYLPWQDVRVRDAAGVVERLDFVFDPASVPEHVR